ncbi:MAG: hypothetical protein ACOC6F_01340 [bacterium]
MEGCVQQIATELGLPVHINLSYVPEDFRPGDLDGFVTTALVDTDRSGGGTQGIIAQVSVPQDTPMFGSSRLKVYPIQVRISENCREHPHTFVAIMAHELSHVLLASLWSTHRDSELYADLVPIVLDFGDYVRHGRKRVETWSSGRATTTETTMALLKKASRDLKVFRIKTRISFLALDTHVAEQSAVTYQKPLGSG